MQSATEMMKVQVLLTMVLVVSAFDNTIRGCPSLHVISDGLAFDHEEGTNRV